MAQTPVCSRLEFRVLGPVEAARDGRTLALGGTRQRALLAALLIDANQVVSTGRLLEEVFEADHTAPAVNRLQVGISRLRRALDDGDSADAAEPVLLTRPGGYLLRVDPDQLDLAMFERLSEDGREALYRGDPAEAATLLRRALALWRGEAFCDLSLVEVAQREVQRLGGLRLAAVMDRLDADLALGADAELIPEVEALVASHPSQERFVGQLMLALYRSGRQADALAVYREQSRVMRLELGLEPTRALVELEQLMLRQDPGLARPERSASGAAAPRVIVCPYKGLASFEAADSEYFCGREQTVANLITRVAGGRLVGIVGASGMGKSSLLRAGLLPALAAGALPGSETWDSMLMRPGTHPYTALTTALRDHTPGRRRLIAVDQFEEVFTACRSARERDRFMGTLAGLAGDPDNGTTVVLALRADFYGRCTVNAAFARLLNADHVLVAPMTREQMLRAVELPAGRVGLELEPGLADALVDDMGDEPGSLPLLSTALLELWAARADGPLTIDTYRSLGGVRGAVARLAERAYSQLTEDEQQASRTLFMRLVSGDGRTATRRRAPLRELDLEGNAELRTAVDALAGMRLLTVSDHAVEVSHEALLHEWPRLEAWMDEDRTGHRLYLHLVAAAAEWDGNGRDLAELYRGARLAAAIDWAAAHRTQLNRVEREFIAAGQAESEREILTQRSRNRRLRGLLAGTVVLLVLAAVAGVAAAVQRAHADSAAAAAHRSATSAEAQSLGAEAVSQPQIGRALLLATEGAKLADSPITRSDLLATILRAPDMLASYYPGPGIRPNAVAVSPDGRLLTVTEFNGDHVLTYDTTTRALVHTVPGYAYSVAYSPDGKTLAAVVLNGNSHDGLYLYDAASGRRLRTLPLPASVPTGGDRPALFHDRSLVFTGDGRFAWTVASNANHGWLVRWDLRTGTARTIRFADDANDDPVFTTDAGDEVAATTNKGRRLGIWSSDTMRPVDRIALPPRFRALALSDDGRTLAIGTNGGTVELITVPGGAIRHLPNGHTSAVGGAAFTPDGRRLVTAGLDDRVIVWSVRHLKLLQTDLGHSSGAQAVVIGSGGDTVYSGSLDGSVIAYALAGSGRFGTPFTVGLRQPEAPDAPTAAVAGDGATAAVMATRGRVALISGARWDIHRSLYLFPDHRSVGGIALSPDGRTLAGSAGVNPAGTAGLPGLRLWRLSGGVARDIGHVTGFPEEQLPTFQTPAFTPDGRRMVLSELYGPTQRSALLAIADAHTGALIGHVVKVPTAALAILVAVGPDGKHVYTADNDGRIRVYSMPALHLLRTSAVVGGDGFGGFQVSPDGRTIAVGDGNGLVHLLDAASLAPIQPPLLTASGPITSVSFNQAGTLLAASGSDAATNLIDVASWRVIGSPLLEPVSFYTSGVISAFASHDRLFTISLGGHATVWPLSLGTLTAHACSVAHRNLTRAEWKEFLPALPYQQVCSTRGTSGA